MWVICVDNMLQPLLVVWYQLIHLFEKFPKLVESFVSRRSCDLRRYRGESMSVTNEREHCRRPLSRAWPSNMNDPTWFQDRNVLIGYANTLQEEGSQMESQSSLDILHETKCQFQLFISTLENSISSCKHFSFFGNIKKNILFCKFLNFDKCIRGKFGENGFWQFTRKKF